MSIFLSIIGVVLASWSAWRSYQVEKKLERLRNRSLLSIRGPEIRDKLKAFAIKLNRHIEASTAQTQGSEPREITSYLKRCSAVLKNLADKLHGGDVHRRSERLHSSIQNALQDHPVDREKLRSIHAELHGLIEAISALLKDIEGEVTS